MFKKKFLEVLVIYYHSYFWNYTDVQSFLAVYKRTTVNVFKAHGSVQASIADCVTETFAAIRTVGCSDLCHICNVVSCADVYSVKLIFTSSFYIYLLGKIIWWRKTSNVNFWSPGRVLWRKISTLVSNSCTCLKHSIEHSAM